MPIRAYAAQSASSPFTPFAIERREPTSADVAIEILHRGVCHSDLHFARNEWGMTEFPVVLGHEIVGRVTRIGDDVTRFRFGDLAGVGCMADSCRSCASCASGGEQFCLGPERLLERVGIERSGIFPNVS